jgi:hypothetical protein
MILVLLLSVLKGVIFAETVGNVDLEDTFPEITFFLNLYFDLYGICWFFRLLENMDDSFIFGLFTTAAWVCSVFNFDNSLV